uniref:USP domain-containing protein n=1 Tax=Oncorhynchus kisutch TaxID=8019 RepID=A0A8C7CK75_ONCKI
MCTHTHLGFLFNTAILQPRDSTTHAHPLHIHEQSPLKQAVSKISPNNSLHNVYPLILQPSHPNTLSSALLSTPPVSPDPKLELKTLKWPISQFASVERIVGEYLCETCHHYTEAERSLPFDKTPPEVVTIHLKCFSVLYNDLYAGLSKVNTPPLQTPFKRSLEEWCMHPSATGGQHYQLFAVVIHSAVTISSGRYTTYIRMMDSKDTKVHLPEGDEKQSGEEEEWGGTAGGARGACPAMTLGATSRQPTQTRQRISRAPGHSSNGGIKEEAEEVLVTGCEGAGGGVSTEQALSSLLQNEGKWMLFDDSEMLFFEEDFLRACSTSTPYLLFYRRVFRQGHHFVCV